MSYIKNLYQLYANNTVGDAVRKSSSFISTRLVASLSCAGFIGTNILNEDFDVLIILDTCRVDALRNIKHKYQFLSDIKKKTSVGSSSTEWMCATFNSRYSNILKDTIYLANNGYAHKLFVQKDEATKPDTIFNNYEICDESDFCRLEHIWKYEEKSTKRQILNNNGPSTTEYLTDRAISVGRNHNFDRLILHYIKPHHPYTANSLYNDRKPKEYEQNPFDYLEDGGSRSKVMSAYMSNLEYVLDNIELLLRNIDAEKIIITADHGESFGEYGFYGHRPGIINPYVRKVPWVVTSGQDKREYNCQYEDIREKLEKDREVNQLLKDLGYKLS